MQPADWTTYLNSEATIMLRHILTNDPRPHYAHQSNLTEDRILLTVMDEVLNRYRSYLTAPIVQPTFEDCGDAMYNARRWSAAMNGLTTAYMQNGVVYLRGSSSVGAPITGTTFGSSYGGDRSGWASISSWSTRTLTISTTVV
jgi:hypothetical protein